MEKDRITKENLDKYRKITEKAFDIAKKSISKGKEKEAVDLIDLGAGFTIKDQNEFDSIVDLLIKSKEKRNECGLRSKELIQSGIGSTNLIINYLEKDILTFSKQ